MREDSARSTPADSITPPAAIDTMSATGAVLDSALTEPQIVAHGSDYLLHLPAAMNAVLVDKGARVSRLSAYNENLRRLMTDIGPRQALFAAVGDFDGDSRDDAAVHATVQRGTDSVHAILVVLNDSIRPRAIEIQSYPFYAGPIGEYVLYRKAETIRSPHEKAPLTLTTDAFEVAYFEKAAVLYYYRGGRFRQYQTSD